jgi:endopeptidase Clp ATP-binding regulatory subunit ClpX
VKADATKFSETGYVGHDAEDLVRDLVKAADGDADLARFGIIFLDEADKLAAAPQAHGRDVSGRGVQVNLLKLMEETDVPLLGQTDLLGQMQVIMDLQRGKERGPATINTRHILFIASGAFDRLAEQVRRRVDASAIGFGQERPGTRASAEYLWRAETRDLVEYGFEPEFVGRLPVRVVCGELEVGDLERILLHSEGSILSQYARDFEGYGIRMDVEPRAVRAIAEAAHRENTGARGLMTVLERALRDFKFELPSLPGARELLVTAELVADPAGALQRILKNSQAGGGAGALASFAAAFHAEHGVRLAFDAAARAAAVGGAAAQGIAPDEFCRRKLRGMEYGVLLAARKAGRDVFRITRRFLADPSAELTRRLAAASGRGR